MNRFGTWAEACERAGLKGGRRVRDEYNPIWTVRECRKWVDGYVLETATDPNGKTLSFQRFSDFCDENNGPSSATVRNKLGLWSVFALESVKRLGV